MKRLLLGKRLLAFLLFWCYCLHAYGQASAYTFSQYQGTYTPISGTQLSFSSLDDGISNVTNIGFPFQFDGVGYTQFTACTNGWIHLGSNTITSNSSPISTGTMAQNPLISFFGRDGSVRGSVAYELAGTAPNRVLTVQYTNFNNYWGTSPMNTMNAQIKLYETSNKIEIVYGSLSWTSSINYTGQVGISSSNANFNNRTATGSWTTTTAGTTNEATLTLSQTVFPSTGLTYVWEAPTCIAPTGLLASNITTNSSTVSWTAPLDSPANGYEYAYTTSNVAPASGTTTSTASANLTNLSANTNYYFWVRSLCSSTEISTWLATNFTTLCNATDVPYTQDFESGTTSTLPSCTSVQNLGNGNVWQVANNPGNGFTSKALRYVYNSSNAANTWFYTQGVNLTAGQSYRISYRYGKNSATYNELLKVAYGTSPTAASMNTVLQDHSPISNTTATSTFVDFTPSTTGVYYFGFHAYSGINFNTIYLDDIVVDLSPTCFAPSNLTASSTTTNSSTISWTAPAQVPANGYEYYYSTTNTAPTATTTGTSVTSTTATITNLTPNTNYYVWVRSVCSSTDISAWSSVLNIYTGYCVPTGSTTYFFSSISTTNALTNLAFTNTTSAVYLDRSTTMFNSYPGNQFNVGIVPSGNASQIFYMWVDWNNDMDFDDAGEAIFATTNSASSYNGTVTVPAGQALGNYRVRIAMGTSGGTIAVSPCSSSWGRYVDFTLVVEDQPTCLAPIYLTSGSTTPNSTTISWTAPAQVPADGYEYYYSTTNTAPTAATTGTSVAATTATITNLTPNTSYYIWVRSVCSSTDVSGWTNVHTVYTGHCVPTSTSSYYVASFNTVGAVSNTSFSTSSAQAYRDNFNTHQIVTYPGQQFTYTINPSSGTNIYYVWIDWNNDLDFDDAGESVVGTTTYASTYAGTLTIPAGQTPGTYRMRIANSWSGNITNACGPASNGTFVDFAIIVGGVPTCVEPGGMTITSLLGNSASISWNAPAQAPANGYEYYYSTTNTAPTTATVGTPVATTSATISNLSPVTAYYVWVRSICSDTDTSNWTISLTFTTPCEAEMAPTAVQTFTSLSSNVNTSLPCWSEATSVAANPFVPTITNSNWSSENFGNGGSNNAAYYNIYRSTGMNWLISNQIDLGTTPGQFRVKYDYAVTDYDETYLTEEAYAAHVVNLIVSTDGGITWSPSNIIYSHEGVYSGGNQITVDLTNYSGVVKFAWRVVENNTTDIDIDFFIDNFVVERIPCTSPVTIAGGGIVCAENDLAAVTVTLPSAGSWEITINDGTNSSVVNATGPEYTFTPTVEGVYTVTAAIGTCNASVFTGLAEVTRRAPMTANNPQTICFGGSYAIGGSIYDAAGTYTDVLTSEINGCDSTVTTILTVLPELTANNPQTICFGDTYTIGGSAYDAAGTYTDVLTSVINGCDSTVTTILTVVEININVTQNQGEFTTTPIGGATYEWINCDTDEVVANTANFTATVNGDYKLRVTVGQCSDQTACYEVTGLSIDMATQFKVDVYPNPTKSSVTVTAGDRYINTIVIYDNNGRLVQEIQLNALTPTLSLTHLENGMYFLHVKTNEATVIKKVTKQD